MPLPYFSFTRLFAPERIPSFPQSYTHTERLSIPVHRTEICTLTLLTCVKSANSFKGGTRLLWNPQREAYRQEVREVESRAGVLEGPHGSIWPWVLPLHVKESD